MGAVISLLPATYSTSKQVVLLDRKLGILYSVCILLVLGYVIGVRLIIDKEYNAVEKSYGVVGVQLNGTTYSIQNGATIPQDVASLVQFEEGNAVFLPTRQLISRDQQLGNCTDPDEHCLSDSDCAHNPPLAVGLCDHQKCTHHSWCNAGGESAQPSDPFASMSKSALQQNEMVLQNFSRISIVLTGTVSFELGDGTLSTEDGRHARTRWTMAQLLQRARLTESDAQTLGAVLSVTLQWNCDNLVNEDECTPHLLVTQLGQGTPYYREWASYHRNSANSGELLRDLYQARGLRLLVTSQGVGQRVDLLQIVTQLFVALALMPIAAGLADTIMQHFFSERRHYREYKTELSPDFSDVRAKVEQLEKQSQSRAQKQMNYA